MLLSVGLARIGRMSHGFMTKMATNAKIFIVDIPNSFADDLTLERREGN